MRRVVVSGLGVVCGVGPTRDTFWNGLIDAQSGFAPLTTVDTTNLRFQLGAEVKQYRPEDHFGDKEASMMDRFAQFAVIAAREASHHAGIVWTPAIAGERGHRDRLLRGRQEHRRRGLRRTFTSMDRTASASHDDPEDNGERRCLARYRWSSASRARRSPSRRHAPVPRMRIGQAFWMVRSGQCDVAITGGSEAPFSFGILKAWEAMRVVSPTVCRPFSKDRNGMILGEGGAMMVLESLEHALARGAQPIAEIVGFGMSSDAHHITQPSAEGGAKAIRAALKRCGYRAGSHRLRECARHGYYSERFDRDACAASRVRRSCAASWRCRPRSRCMGIRWARLGRLKPRRRCLRLQRGPASHHRFQRSGPRVRSGLHAVCGAFDASGVCDFEFIRVRWFECGAGVPQGHVALRRKVRERESRE